MVLCVDEKGSDPGVGAERSLCCNLGLGYVEGVTHGYMRHGATDPLRRPRAWPQARSWPSASQGKGIRSFCAFSSTLTPTCPLTSMSILSWTITAPVVRSSKSIAGSLPGPAITSTSPGPTPRGSSWSSLWFNIITQKAILARLVLLCPPARRQDPLLSPAALIEVTPLLLRHGGLCDRLGWWRVRSEDPETMYSYLWDTPLAHVNINTITYNRVVRTGLCWHLGLNQAGRKEGQIKSIGHHADFEGPQGAQSEGAPVYVIVSRRGCAPRSLDCSPPNAACEPYGDRSASRHATSRRKQVPEAASSANASRGSRTGPP